MTNTQYNDPKAPLTAVAGTWQLDTAASSVELRTKAMWGLAKVKASFAAVGGGGTVSSDGTVSGALVFDAASVDTGQAKRDAHLRTADFFDVAQYPTFEYAVTSATITPTGEATVSGTFTAHGQTRPLQVGGRVAGLGTDRLTVTVEADLDRSEWGIGWTKMGASLKNHVVVTAVFTR